MYLISFILFYSAVAFSTNHLTFLGGGGEPRKLQTTIFDDSLPALNDFVTKASGDWKYDIYFNGGHESTEKIIQNNFANASTKKDFTNSSLQMNVEKYIDNIKSGQIKSGDQIMVMINTHGSEKTSQTGTHFLAAGAVDSSLNLQNLSGAQSLVNMDQLKELTALAAKQGVKMAIVDFSCYSGNSLSLANENTCVVTSTGTKHFGYTTFAPLFLSKMKPGQSLESVFINTRSEINDNSYPMISTPAGQEINDLLYNSLTPYLYYESNFGGSQSMLSKYIEQAAAKPEICNHKNNFEQLEKQLDSLNTIFDINSEMEAKKEIDVLKNKLKKYKKLIDGKIEVAIELGARDIFSNEKIKVVGKADYKRFEYDINNSYTVFELLEINFKKLINGLEEALQEAKLKATAEKTKKYDQDIGGYIASIEMHKNAEKKSIELLSKNPNFKDYQEKFNVSMKNIQAESKAAADEIAKQERKIYDLVYKQKMKKSPSKNACSDFIL